MAEKSMQKQGFFATVKEFIGLLLLVFLIRTFGFGLYQVPTGSMETTMLVGERFFADKLTPLFMPFKHGDIISFNDPSFDYSSDSFKRLWQEYVWGPSNWTKRIVGIPGDTIKGTVENGKPVVYLNGKKLDEPYVNKYPLISVWKEDPHLIAQQAEREVIQKVQSKELTPAGAERYLQRRFASQLCPRSFDPSIAYDKQPFYRINEHLIFTDPDTGKPELKMPGTPLDRDLNGIAQKKDGDNYWNGTDEFQVKLSDNQYWVMGDNRLGSSDCRVFGPIDGRLIHGKILFRIWSVDSNESWWIIDLIKNPVDFFKRIRWSRFFQRVR